MGCSRLTVAAFERPNHGDGDGDGDGDNDNDNDDEDADDYNDAHLSSLGDLHECSLQTVPRSLA